MRRLNSDSLRMVVTEIMYRRLVRLSLPGPTTMTLDNVLVTFDLFGQLLTVPEIDVITQRSPPMCIMRRVFCSPHS